MSNQVAATSPASSWKNPYIEKVHTLPELLLPCESHQVTSQQKEFVVERGKSFSRNYLEIGSGSGAHLIERAAKDPEGLYIGIELRYKRAFRTAEKAKERGVSNLLVIRGNAHHIGDLFDGATLDGVYINFPDPWAKKKWKKNRLVNPDYLKELHALLIQGGFLSFKTDHREYFRSSLEVFSGIQFFEVTDHTEDLHGSEHASDNVMTEFESLFKSQGLSPCYLKAIARPLA